MKTPLNYPIDLASNLEVIATSGSIPGKIHVNNHEIVKEIKSLISNNIASQERILVFSNRDIDLLSYFPGLKLINSLTLADVEDDLKKLDISSFDQIIIFSDWVSIQSSLHKRLQNLNIDITQNQKFNIIELNIYKPYKLIQCIHDDKTFNWFKYLTWLKSNSSHMHLGYKTIIKKHVTIHNLKPNY